MTWTVYADPFSDADMSGTSRFSPFKPDRNITLRAVRTWFVLYGDPTFTSLTAKIYTDPFTSSVHSIGDLVATSTNTITKADLLTVDGTSYDNGVRETYFEFDPFDLDGGDWYALVVNATGYTFSDSSHVAWMKAIDPVMSGYTPSLTGLGLAPYQMHLIFCPKSRFSTER